MRQSKPPERLVGNSLRSVFGEVEMELAAQRIIRLAVQAKTWQVRLSHFDFQDGNQTGCLLDGFVDLVSNGWLRLETIETADQNCGTYYYTITAEFVLRLRQTRPWAFKSA